VHTCGTDQQRQPMSARGIEAREADGKSEKHTPAKHAEAGMWLQLANSKLTVQAHLTLCRIRC
jgi:hypothetical protein